MNLAVEDTVAWLGEAVVESTQVLVCETWNGVQATSLGGGLVDSRVADLRGLGEVLTVLSAHGTRFQNAHSVADAIIELGARYQVARQVFRTTSCNVLPRRRDGPVVCAFLDASLVKALATSGTNVVF